MCAEFKKRRDVMVTGLNKIKGFSCRLPKGAFYVFPNITKTGWPSKKLADALLDDAGVAALSGTAFGDFGEGYMRFSVANSIKNRARLAHQVRNLIWIENADAVDEEKGRDAHDVLAGYRTFSVRGTNQQTATVARYFLRAFDQLVHALGLQNRMMVAHIIALV